MLHFVLFVVALRSGGFPDFARRRVSPWIPTSIKSFARRLNGGSTDVLGIRDPLLLQENVDIILWAVLFALYHKWIPKTQGLGDSRFHEGWEPSSGYDISITLMLALVGPLSTTKPGIISLTKHQIQVIASFSWAFVAIFRLLIAGSPFRNEYHIALELLCSTVLLTCGIVAFRWKDDINLQLFATFNELCITVGPPILGEDQFGGAVQRESHTKVLRGLKISALVFVYLVA